MKRWIIAGLLILPAACQKVPSEHDTISPICASAQAVRGEEIGYSELIDSRNYGTYVLRNIRFGVDGKASLSQDLSVQGRRISPGIQHCRAPDGGTMNSFRLSEVDPNLIIPANFSANNGNYTSYIDLFFRSTSQGVIPEGRLARCQTDTLAGVFSKLQSGGATVRIFRDQDTVVLLVERTLSDPYIYRARLTFREI